ncbi:MAG: hypothetical protein MR314_03065 [Ezakiella sp.]|nr:hypothetical protein [Ezakiella sp.]
MIETIVNILKVLFAISFLTITIYMTNYLFKKAGWNNFFKVVAILGVVGICMIGQVYLARIYAYFELNQGASPKVLGFSRMIFMLFLILLSLFSYYMYIIAFKKKRYQKQLNLILVFAIVSLVLAILPQNDYSKANPGTLMPRLRAIPSMILGLYVAAVLLMDGYYKRNARFQRYAALLILVQVFHFIYAFPLKAKAGEEYLLFILVSMAFVMMIYIFYRQLSKINELDRF